MSICSQCNQPKLPHRVCDNCGHYISEDEFDRYGSWNYRCDECGFRYIHGSDIDKLKEWLVGWEPEKFDIEEGNKLGVAGYIVKANSTPAEVIEQVINILNKKK